MTCSHPWWYSVCVGLWVGFMSNFWEYCISHLKFFTITLISGTVSPKSRPVTFKICEYLMTQIVLLSLCESVSCDLSENGYVCIWPLSVYTCRYLEPLCVTHKCDTVSKQTLCRNISIYRWPELQTGPTVSWPSCAKNRKKPETDRFFFCLRWGGSEEDKWSISVQNFTAHIFAC